MTGRLTGQKTFMCSPPNPGNITFSSGWPAGCPGVNRLPKSCALKMYVPFSCLIQRTFPWVPLEISSPSQRQNSQAGWHQVKGMASSGYSRDVWSSFGISWCHCRGGIGNSLEMRMAQIMGAIKSKQKTHKQNVHGIVPGFGGRFLYLFFSPMRNERTHKQNFATDLVLGQSHKFVYVYVFFFPWRLPSLMSRWHHAQVVTFPWQGLAPDLFAALHTTS